MDTRNTTPRNTDQRNQDSGTSRDGVPVIPLPNPGEGGPVYPGNTEGMGPSDGATPVIPLPNPGEGGPVYPGWTQNGNNTTLLPNIIGTIISTYPRPNEPCRFCSPTNPRAGYARFLNAAAGYNPFVVFLNQNMFSNALNFSEVTAYERVGRGTQVVTIMGENGYIYVQKQVDFMDEEYITIAIINTQSGLDIQVIKDSGCDRGSNMACIRAVNLAYYSGALNVTVGNQYITFPNLKYRDVANFESAWPGLYIYTVSRNMTARFPALGETALLSAGVNLQRNRNYTIYLMNWTRDSVDAVKAIVVEDL